MRRRDFIRAISGAVAAWPIAARTQQPERVRRIGVLMSGVAEDPESKDRIAAFRQALRVSGWAEGRNVRSITGGVREVPTAFAATRRSW